MPPFTDLSRLSLNQATTQYWSLREAVDGCARAGIPAISVWRDKVAELGLQASARLVRDAGLSVSSVCRGGWFGATSGAERLARLDDNRRALDEAAALGTDTLVLVCGPAPDRDLVAARAWVEEALVRLLPDAEARGVRLAVEPLHPMFTADRSVVASLGQANDLVERLASPWVGLTVDAYHVWWDPRVYQEIERAAGSILGFHVSDWLVPTPDILLGRGMMGDGVIELRRLRVAVDEAGYDGPIECEIFNREIWDMPGDAVLEMMKQRFVEHC